MQSFAVSSIRYQFHTLKEPLAMRSSLGDYSALAVAD
jgi:hypothetical protein